MSRRSNRNPKRNSRAVERLSWVRRFLLACRRHEKLVIALVTVLVGGTAYKFQFSDNASIIHFGTSNVYYSMDSGFDTNVLCDVEGGDIKRCRNVTNELIEAVFSGKHDKFNISSSTNQYCMGLLYFKGVGVEKSYEEAAKWLLLAAENDLPIAQHAIGVMYGIGIGVTEDAGRAFYWESRAAAAGHIGAMHNVGMAYLRGIGTEKDLALAYKYLNSSFQGGSILSACVLGYMYTRGEGVEKNWMKGFGMLLVAAEKLHSAFGQYLLSRVYGEGNGGFVDKEKAFRYLKMSAEQGYIPAMWDIADAYEEGVGVKVDRAMALFFREKASRAEKNWEVSVDISISGK